MFATDPTTSTTGRMTLASTRRAGGLAIARRLGWLAAFGAAIGFAAFEVIEHGLGPLPIVAFLIMPDLAMLAGIGQPHLPRQLPARAVPVYNLLHQPLLPIAVVVIALILPLDLFWFVAGLAWFAHIAIDRAVGYGQRTPDGWQRG